MAERLVFLGKCVGIVGVFSWFFYRSLWAVLPLASLGILYGYQERRRQAGEDRYRLLVQFCDMLQAVSASMRAGYSVENALVESLEDMRLMHGADAIICEELQWIRHGLELNQAPDGLLADLAQRSHVPQIREFAEVFSIGYHSSGNISAIIQMTTENLCRKVQLREEIRTVTAARRMERNIMNVMPFAILIYIEITGKGYFDALYHNLTGVLVMSGCLVVYVVSFVWSQYILTQIQDREGEMV